jgi:hypothetical protein
MRGAHVAALRRAFEARDWFALRTRLERQNLTDEQAAYEELYVYTMGRPGFILQHVVDAWAVQTTDADTKPIKVVFGLIGLYLRVEKGWTGRQVQLKHMELGKRKRDWPRVRLPEGRGKMRVTDVMVAVEGETRDRAIDGWCRSVWEACGEARHTIVTLLDE